MSQGTTLPLTIHQDPYTVANCPVSWTSSNSAVATVDQNGLVTIRKPGTTNITATAQDINRISNTLPLTIYYVDTANKLTATVDAPSIGLQPGQTAAMTVRGDGEISSSCLSFTSSNPEIVTVEDGILTAGETTGTATITATLVGDPLITEEFRNDESLAILDGESVAEEAHSFTVFAQALTHTGAPRPSLGHQQQDHCHRGRQRRRHRNGYREEGGQWRLLPHCHLR